MVAGSVTHRKECIELRVRFYIRVDVLLCAIDMPRSLDSGGVPLLNSWFKPWIDATEMSACSRQVSCNGLH